jgi:hypothetical protein
MLGGCEISRARANGFAGLAHGLLATRKKQSRRSRRRKAVPEVSCPRGSAAGRWRTKGHSPEVERAFAGARDLCGQVGETRSFARC